MSTKTFHYAGYKIVISYDEDDERYRYVIINKDGLIICEAGPFEDNNDAFASACMWINDET